MVAVAQLVRVSDCGSECRGFKSRQPPQLNNNEDSRYEWPQDERHEGVPGETSPGKINPLDVAGSNDLH